MFTFFFIFIGFTAAWLAFDYFSRVPAAAILSPARADQRLKADASIQLIDVRTEKEFKGGHIGAAVNIPLHEFSSKLAGIDKARPIIVYCRSGHRSAFALKMLLKHGFDACHIQGGILKFNNLTRRLDDGVQ